MTLPRLRKGDAVRVVPVPRSRLWELDGLTATVLSWSQAENCYRVRFADGGQRIIHRSELEPA